MNPEKKVFFLTGASGVGKSTIRQELEKHYKTQKNITILEFDSIGVPSKEEMIRQYGSGEEWQRATTKKWIDKILGEFKESTILIEGSVRPNFIDEAFEENEFSNYQTILIHCNEEEMLKRIIERGQPELATKDMKGWRKYLHETAKENDLTIIDTGVLSIQESTQQLIKILNVNATT